MSELSALFAVLGGLAFILANLAVWAPRRLRVKLGALITVAVFLPTAYFALSEMLARPKPVAAEWLRGALAEATVLGAQMQEGKAIYLWLALEGTAEPRAYALPWSEKIARQLHGARRSAEASGTRVKMRLPFQDSLDRRDRVFYAAPQPPPPEKQTPVQNPLNFQHSRSNPGTTNN
ncbi:MAG: hypothetical protein IH805_01410 [Proteobacteria bacterium]|nr:hypothetical protein [Pseudomonadota bacterium]